MAGNTFETGTARIDPMRRLASCGIGLAALCPSLVLAARAVPAVLLATDAAPGVDPAGHLVSEKYDGVRALWDGRELRFRSGRGVQAPRDFLRRLPPLPLDGELWLGRGRFEALSGIVRRERPRDGDWRGIRYMVFELPGAAGTFEQRAQRIRTLVGDVGWDALVAVDQAHVADAVALQRRLDEVVSAGGEGLVLHRADAPWLTGRSGVLRKLKPLQDADALVIGHLTGQGKYADRLGALRVRTAEGREFQIGTGFSDAQRADPPAIGTRVTYTHRGLTDSGLPRFASFLRVHPGL